MGLWQVNVFLELWMKKNTNRDKKMMKEQLFQKERLNLEMLAFLMMERMKSYMMYLL